jgi:WD40 repeat protein
LAGGAPAHDVRSERFQKTLRPMTGFTLCLLVFGLLPIASASSGLAWSSGVEISSQTDSGAIVEFSHDGSIIASGHGSQVMIIDTASRTEIQRIVVDFTVESIAFSSDDSRLIIGMASVLLNTPAAVVYEAGDSGFSRARHTEDGIHVNQISISSDDSTFAIANENGGVTEWSIGEGTVDSLASDRDYPATHTGEVTCIDHSTDGTHLLTAGEGGLVILWNRSDQIEVERWETADPVRDCTFSHDGSLMVWMSGASLYIRNHDATFSYQDLVEIDSRASRLAFTADDGELVLLIPERSASEERHLQFFTLDAEGEISTGRRVVTAHVSLDFSISPDETLLAVSTDSSVLAFYSNSRMELGDMPGGIDTDQDDIPDSVDDDDDGDGTPDVFDNVCIEGGSCDLHPDQDTIRRIGIAVDGIDVAVRDTFHLTGDQSQQIRLLASHAITVNHQVGNDEARAISTMLCSEYDAENMLNRWSSVLTIADQPFHAREVSCVVESGLKGTDRGDGGTRIVITWTVSGRIGSAAQAPYNITLTSGVQPPDASIAMIMHAFPVNVQIDDVTGSRAEEEVWNRRDPSLRLAVQVIPEDKPDQFEQALGTLENYWYIVVLCIISLLALMAVLMMRRQNVIDFGDKDEEIEESEPKDEWEDLVDDAAAWDEDWDEDPVTQGEQPRPPAAVRRDIRRKPKPPIAVQRDLARQDQEEDAPRIKVRRTIASSEQEKESDSEVDFTHLVETEPTPEEPTVEVDEEIDSALNILKRTTEAAKTKRRRPIKRRKPE